MTSKNGKEHVQYYGSHTDWWKEMVKTPNPNSKRQKELNKKSLAIVKENTMADEFENKLKD